MKKSLIFWFAAATCAAWILVGCESPTNGDAGAAGAPGTIYLSGSQTTAGIQDAIDSGAPLVFAGVTQYDTGEVIVPAGRKVKLVGEAAFTTNGSGTILLEDAGSIQGNGKIGGSGTIIGDAAISANVSGTLIAYAQIGTGGELTFPGGKAAVNGNVTIGAAGGTGTITPATLGANTLYVVGDLTVNAALTGAATLNVLGDATVGTADQTQDVVWNVKGTLTANKAPTTASGSVKANTLDVSQAGAAISLLGTVDVETLKTAGTVVITTDAATGLEADTVTGAATFATDAKIASADFAGAVTFNGTATLGEVTFNNDVTTTSGSALMLSNDEAVTLAATKSIKVGTDIVLTAGAANVVLTPGGATTLTPAAKQLTLGAADLTLTSGALTVAAGATLTLDKVLTVAAGAELVVAGNVTVTASTGGLTLTAASATGGAKLSCAGNVTAGATEITGVWQAVGSGNVAITAVATGATITSSADTAVLTAGTGGTITQTAEASNALTIAAATTVALGGDGTEVGKIVLKGDANNPGKLIFGDAGSGDVGTSLVTTGSSDSSNKIDAVTKIAGNTSVGTAIVGYFDNDTIGSATKFWKLGASNSTNYIVGGGAATDTELSGKSYSSGNFST